MTNWRTLVEKDYIGSWDIPKGKDVVVQIARVESKGLHTAGSKSKRKPVLYFHGAEKGMVANTTNCLTLESMYGEDFENWVGKWIAIYVAKTTMNKKTVDGLRIRPNPPRGKATQERQQEPEPELPTDEREPGSEG